MPVDWRVPAHVPCPAQLCHPACLLVCLGRSLLHVTLYINRGIKWQSVEGGGVEGGGHTSRKGKRIGRDRGQVTQLVAQSSEQYMGLHVCMRCERGEYCLSVG